MTDPVPAEEMSREGKSIRKPEPQDVTSELLKANQMVQEERRNSDRRVAQEKERARQEIERVRAESERRLQDMTAERRVFLKTIAQLQTELEAKEREITLVRAKLEAVEWVRQGYAPREAPGQNGTAEPGAESVAPAHLAPATLPVTAAPDGKVPENPGSIFRVAAAPQPGRPKP